MTLATTATPPISKVSMHKISATSFIGRLADLTRRVQVGNASALRHAKAAQLPTVQACQSALFATLQRHESELPAPRQITEKMSGQGLAAFLWRGMARYVCPPAVCTKRFL